jgi:hypothetical protein
MYTVFNPLGSTRVGEEQSVIQEQSINFRKDVLNNLTIAPKRYCVSDSKMRNLKLVVYPLHPK